MWGKTEKRSERKLIFATLFAFFGVVSYLFMTLKCEQSILDVPGHVKVKNGDVLLFGSLTFRGMLLKLLDIGTRWTHVGLAEVTAENEVFVIHADPEVGVVVRESLAQYLKSEKVCALSIMRPEAKGGDVVVDFAKRCVDRKAPFNNSFRYKCGQGYYCTELVVLAWEAVGIVLLPDVKIGDCIRPSELLSSSLMSLVWQTQ